MHTRLIKHFDHLLNSKFNFMEVTINPKPYSELPLATSVEDNDLFLLLKGDGGSRQFNTIKKGSISNVASAVHAITAGSAQSATTANTASSLTTARTISLSGEVTGTPTAFNGSTNIAISTTIANISPTPTGSPAGPATNQVLTSGGTFTVPYINFNAKGQVTSAANRTMTLPASAALPPYSTTFTSLEFGGIGVAGTANTIARGDHKHTIDEGSLATWNIDPGTSNNFFDAVGPGRYYKIGKLVFITGSINIKRPFTFLSTSTYTIYGLPIKSVSSGYFGRAGIITISAHGFTSTPNNALVGVNTNYIYWRPYFSPAQVETGNNQWSIDFSGCYLTD